MVDQESPQFWVNTVSLDHVRLGVEGGFTQADHGSGTRLRRLRRGDGLVFYSPRTAMRSGDPVQQFSAIGTVTDDEPHRAHVKPGFEPWRRTVDFHDSAAADVRPLVPDLAFVTNKQSWGMPFRRGLFSVERDDFLRIAEAMGVGDAGRRWPPSGDRTRASAGVGDYHVAATGQATDDGFTGYTARVGGIPPRTRAVAPALGNWSTRVSQLTP